jgi:SAM-dependent methyltransferase
MDDYRRANQALWNEYTRVNSTSQMYDLDGFKAGRNSLHPLEIGELGSVQEKSLLHLQCHFGMDTLTWARLGAQVTGIDFSPKAIELARSLAAELNIPARFIQSDLYDLPNQLHETFDIVFTSYGVLTWLSDIPRWAKIAASYVKPGGTFYIAEIHPVSYIFSDQADHFEPELDYFKPDVMEFTSETSYSGPTPLKEPLKSYEWNYPLGTVVSSLIDAGLHLEFLHEFPYAVYPQFSFLERGADGRYWAPAGMPQVPLLFSIKATR